MRVELIKCDNCKNEHSTRALPIEWVELSHPNYEKNNGREKHFCSIACLSNWASWQKVSNRLEERE